MYRVKLSLVAACILGLSGLASAAESKGDIELGVTAYGVYSYATNGSDHEGQVFQVENALATPGWSGSGGGFGVGFSAMWRGYIGLDVQVIKTYQTLKGTFSDPRGTSFSYTQNARQYHIPIMIKTAWPTQWVTPTLSAGLAWRWEDSSTDSLTLEGDGPERLSAWTEQGSNWPWMGRFGAGVEKRLPIGDHDMRVSLNLAITYDQKIADALDGDGRTSICHDLEQPIDDSDTSILCSLYPLGGRTAWQTDVMLGLGYHF